MAIKAREQAVIDLVINGQQARASLVELNGAYNALRASVARLRQEDNPALYAQQVAALDRVRAARNAERAAIEGQRQSSNGFFKDFIQGIRQMNGIAGGVAAGTLIAGWVMAGVGALKEFMKSIVDTYVTFEKFGVVLTNALGDASSARRAINMLQKFAADTPYSLQELTSSYVKLVNRGIVPTMEEMRKMGDLAASQGKSFDQLTEAILDAASGEFERLKEFGIKASKHGDIVRLSFKGITQEVKNTEDAITSALLKFGEMDGVAGGMEKLSETVGGAISNMGDNWDRLLTTLGSKTGGWLYSSVSWINEHLNNLVEGLKSTEQRIQEMADADAAESLKDYKKQSKAEQRITYGGNVQELKYYKDQVEDLEGKIALLKKQGSGGYRGNWSKIADMQRTIDDLNLNIAKTQAFIETVDADNERAAENDRKRKEQQAMAERDAAEKAAKELAKKYERERNQTIAGLAALAKEYKQFEAAQLLDTIDSYDKEAKALEDKFNDEINKQKEGLTKKYINEQEAAQILERIKHLEEGRDQAHDRLRLTRESDITEAITHFTVEQSKKVQNEYEKRLQDINEYYDKWVAKVSSSQEEVDRLNKARNAALEGAARDHENDFFKKADKIAAGGQSPQDEEMAKINDRYSAELDALQDKFGKEYGYTLEYMDAVDNLYSQWQEAKDKAESARAAKKKQELKEFAVEVAQQTSDAFFNISAQNREAQLNAELKHLADQREVELSNKNLTEDQKTAINERYAKKEAEIKLKAWEAQRSADITQAIINGALAVTKVLAQTGVVAPLVIPGIVASTLAQIAVIADQPPPQFKTGGLIADGPSHEGGGIDLVNNQTGQRIAEIEGGEPLMVLSKATMANNGALINELLFNSMYRNGARVDVPALSNRLQQARNGGVIRESIRNPDPASPPQTSAAGNGNRISELEDKLIALTDLVTSEAKKPITLNYHHLKREMDRNGEIENNSKG